jgi:hypothetical protein
MTDNCRSVQRMCITEMPSVRGLGCIRDLGITQPGPSKQPLVLFLQFLAKATQWQTSSSTKVLVGPHFRATFVPSTRTGSHLMQRAGTCHSRLTTTGSKASTPTRVWSIVPSLDRPYMLLGALCPSGGEPSAQPGEK